ncbi:hypothetical protein HBH56_156010 [Parastagonospora nodorum]|uniref:Integral membrane protein TmpA n=1 Tax=Phaeosphaeria nodorum (strain SN15 / ATCC MYA-4574 / FGSC 10173) TaxID=321614 RepID=A0A7U2EZ78_PHANO|nr:hypothetical protein HBH56_156010 [Parastagonospora nodorum]QRC95814.1 hypothetical protein JI435_054640 [Parastagonospora nodorum SN15]KAH3926833.1 hypothetical protein HBH54_161660 [Parastagonospora nodorum]KAH3943335.1 hypothetical protein HBH53_177500 [Parastagonospora nodorum]KAH3972134.1 hypothetical protein HBH51_104000 [Parastagonospora nodorum]
MYTSSDRSCKYQNWWDGRTPRAGHEKSQHKGDGSMVLPLPAFPPALEFDPTQFALPPAYEDIDLEKAVLPGARRFSNASTLYQDSIAQKRYQLVIKADQDSLHRPIPWHRRVIRCLRYSILTVYRRLFTFVFTLNLIGVFLLLRQQQQRSHADRRQLCTTFAALASSNFLLAILVRQDYLVNLLFRTAWLVPWSAPSILRRLAARVYCYGGLHSGAAVAGTVWWIGFTSFTSWMFIREASSFAVTVIAWSLLLLLLVILLLSLPTMRAKFHNTFEVTHRFLGWTSVALFWTQLLLLAHSASTPHQSITNILLHDITFWNLTLLTFLLIYPWLRLRRWTFTAHVLSPHAIRLSFPHAIHRFSCLSISTSPLHEWHPFATFPSAAGPSMVISNAGDWTRGIIGAAQHHAALARAASAQTGRKEEAVKMHFYIKSHPKAGVLSLSLLFPRVLILTTGSGIGPALSSLLERPVAQHARLIWSTRSPLKTYGSDIMALVDKADPNAIVLDTDHIGRPDLLEVVWRESRRERVDAVFVLSNEKVVRWVVGGLEGRGVSAYGPIWDS